MHRAKVFYRTTLGKRHSLRSDHTLELCPLLLKIISLAVSVFQKVFYKKPTARLLVMWVEGGVGSHGDGFQLALVFQVTTGGLL